MTGAPPLWDPTVDEAAQLADHATRARTNGHSVTVATSRVPPHDLDAEAHLLGAALIDPDAAAVLADLAPDAFYKPAHAHIAAAVIDLHNHHDPIDPLTVADRLNATGLLDLVGGHAALMDVLSSAPATSNARSYAAIVRRHARLRRVLGLAGEAAEAAYALDYDRAVAHLQSSIDEVTAPAPEDRYLAGGDWLIDAPPGIPAVWGDGDDVLWAEGESLIIAGPPGVGKTTLTGQIVFARLGLHDTVLGYPVTPTTQRVLYLPMDRPRQIQRAFARLVRPEHRAALNDRLVVRPGPPPADLGKHPETLAAMARQAGAGTVIIDSLKDAAIGLADDEVGSSLNRAMQTCLADGIEVAALHHQRKSQNGHKPKTLEDLYGSTWISAGAGSVILLWGNPGDPLVELTHLKQPGAPVGPLKIEHDHLAGTSTVAAGFDLLAYLRGQPRPVTADQASRARLNRDPTPNDVRVTRRTLDSLATRGLAHRTETPTAGGGKPTALWAAVDDRHEDPT